MGHPRPSSAPRRPLRWAKTSWLGSCRQAAYATFARAAELDPAVLRSLDAVHLAAAWRLGDDLEGIVTDDDRMADAAAVLGLRVLSP